MAGSSTVVESGPRPAFIGIDLAFAKGKRLPVVVCRWRDGKLVPEPLCDLDLEPPQGRGNRASLSADMVAEFVDETFDYLLAVCHKLGLKPECIGIDAPSAPRAPNLAKRLSEKALGAAKISYFTTPSHAEFAAIQAKAGDHVRLGRPANTLPYANKLWMLVGFALFDRLRHLAPCIEVFPQATAHALECSIHKSKPGGVEAQLCAAAKYTGWPMDEADRSLFARIAWGPAHDRLDAYLSAWVASLPETRRRGYGVGANDTIWIPVLAERPPRVAHSLGKGESALVGATARAHRSRSKSTSFATRPRLCPACKKKMFKRWPWGWDGHAAICDGLESQGLGNRKEEFKARYGSFFLASAEAEIGELQADDIRIEVVSRLPPGFDFLLVESRSEGLNLLARLDEEARSESPPFLSPGGCLLAALRGDELLGICALYRDPLLDDPSVARLRHLYVAAASRRLGIGRRLVEEAVRRARGRFRRIRLRTDSSGAAALYLASGFVMTSEEGATHEQHLAQSL